MSLSAVGEGTVGMGCHGCGELVETEVYLCRFGTPGGHVNDDGEVVPEESGEWEEVDYCDSCADMARGNFNGETLGCVGPKRLFEVQGLEGAVEGYDTREKWNGWACPVFTREQVVQMGAALAWPISWEGDAACFLTDGPDVDVFEPRPDGLYPIGTQGWCWDVVS